MMSKWKQISSLVRSKGLVPSLLPSSYTFTPNKEEVIGSRFRLRYSTTCNSYYRDWSDAIDPSAQGVIPGWDKVLYSVDSVHRHINEQVGQVYLERTPGSDTGCIKWRINFGCCGLLVDEVTIRVLGVEEYGGEILVTLTGSPGEKRVRYPIGSDYVTYNELENSTELTLTVHFVGEPGQVTRLFPQNILRGMGYPLDIQVTLKQPLQSLGKPRMLVGLLYSSSQEIEVDGRHYKQNTSNTGQGFLHVHLLRAMDLPEGKNGLPETFSKCYLLPDAKKSTKCRTKSRKGKDPLWNEQFLIVGVNFHDVKRRALEICIADSHTSVGKKAKLLGGLRLSLGYKAVVDAQTKQVNQVLRLLKGKGGVIGGRKTDNEGAEGINVNSSFAKWKRASGKHVAKDNKVIEETESTKVTVDEPAANDKTTREANVENEPQSASSTSTADTTAACDSVPDPAAKSEQESGTSPEKGRSPEERLFHTVLASIRELDIAARNSAVLEYDHDGELQLREQDDPRENTTCLMTTNGHHNEDATKDGEQESNDICSHIIENDAEQEENSFKESENQNKNDLNSDDKFTLNDNNKANEFNEREKHSQNKADLEEHDLKQTDIQGNDNLANEQFLLNDIKKYEAILENEDPPNPSEKSRAEQDKNSDKQSGEENCNKVEEAKREEKNIKIVMPSSALSEKHGSVKTLEGKSANQQIKVDSLESECTKPQGTAKTTSTRSNAELKRSTSFTFREFGKKLNFRRRSRSMSEETVSEKGFEAKADKVMLDAEGLEITQWTLVVDRPKQWHYCWHILRPEMTILH